MKLKNLLITILLVCGIPSSSSSYWEYLQELGFKKVSNFLMEGAQRLRQQPSAEEEKKEEFLNFDIDMFNIPYYVPQKTISFLNGLKSFINNANYEVKKAIGTGITSFLKQKLSLRAHVLADLRRKKYNEIAALINQFNENNFEQIEIIEQEKNYGIIWTKKTEALLSVRKSYINQLYTALEQHKANLTKLEKQKLLVLHKKWTTLHAIAMANTTEKIRKITQNFETFLVQQLGFITKNIKKIIPKQLISQINLFNQKAIQKDKNMQFLLQQDIIEKGILDVFWLEIDKKITDQILKERVTSYNDQLTATLKHTLLPYSDINVAAVNNFIINEKKQNKVGRIAAFEALEEYMHRNKYVLEKNKETRIALITRKTFQETLTTEINKLYQSIQTRQSQLATMVVQKIKTKQIKEYLLTKLNNIAIQPRETYQTKADLNSLKNIEAQIKILEQQINKEIQKEQPSVFAKVKGWFGGPKLATQLEKDKTASEIKGKLGDLLEKTNELPAEEDRQIIKNDLEQVHNYFILNIANVQTEQELQTLKEDIEENLNRIKEHWD